MENPSGLTEIHRTRICKYMLQKQKKIAKLDPNSQQASQNDMFWRTRMKLWVVALVDFASTRNKRILCREKCVCTDYSLLVFLKEGHFELPKYSVYLQDFSTECFWHIVQTKN